MMSSLALDSTFGSETLPKGHGSVSKATSSGMERLASQADAKR
jgi:hypothetical protein